MAGPALIAACWPVRTKMPAPMTPPMPSRSASRPQAALEGVLALLVRLGEQHVDRLLGEQLHVAISAPLAARRSAAREMNQTALCDEPQRPSGA